MKRPRLITTPARVLLALGAGWLVLAASWLVLLIALDPADWFWMPYMDPQPALPFPLGYRVRIAAMMAAVIAAVLMLAPVAPLWLVAQLRRASRTAASVLAALIGFAMFSQLLWRGDSLSAAAAPVYAAATGFVLGYTIWTIAYPKRLQTAPPANAF